ncbi:MAG: ABC transporter ATP-binding protein [Planctomycetota bacterium]
MALVAALTAKELRVRLGRTQVLAGIDLEVRTGDVYGLLGPNGAGKTTTMRCLLGFLPWDSGSCSVLGVSSKRLHALSTSIGVALDPPGLDDTLSVRENLVLACRRGGVKTGRGVEEVLELLDLSAQRNNRGDRLSHGQSRRAAVARALLGAPQMLVLDEPLSGLDPEGVEALLVLFRRLAREEGVTVVLSSHHLREVQEVCNRVGLIAGGQVVLEGETERLLAEAGDGLKIRCGRPQACRELLASHALVQEVEVLGGGRLQARVAAGVPLAPLLEKLAGAGIGLEEFSLHRSSLMEVYRRAVG